MSQKSRQRKFQGQRPPQSPQSPAAKTAPHAPAAHKPWQIAAVCIVLVLVTLLAFHGMRNNDFVAFDDGVYVFQNSHVQHGLNAQSIAWAFTTFTESNWHPLTWISHIIDWSLYGSNPIGHHITNVCLHAVNAVLLFLLLLYMTGFLGRSAIVAFLFALHPAHVESVAWLAERKDVLCVFFWLATLLAYAYYVRKPSWKRFAFVICGFACALMSKPMAVTLPLTLLLLDYWPLRRITLSPETRSQWLPSLWKLCIEKWPLFIMSAFSSYMTIAAQRAGSAIAPLQDITILERFSNAAISYCRYISIMVWPEPLRAFYYHDTNNMNVAAAMLSMLALILVTTLCWRFRKQKPYLLAGWLWFLGTLVPVIGIVQVGLQAMAERYTYLPFIGLFIAIVWLVGDAVANSPKLKVAAQVLAVAVLLACAIKTDAQVKVWKNTVTLFTHVIEVDPRGELPNLNLAAAYAKQGNNAEAEIYFNRTLDYYSNDTLALSFTAYCLMVTCAPHEQSNLPLARQRLEQALRVSPDDPSVLTNMALWSSLVGKPQDEEMYSRKVIAAHPDLIQSRIYLADALEAQGKLDQAVQEYRQVFTLDPGNYQAHNQLGILFITHGLAGEAMKQFQLSLSIDPHQSVAHTQIGRILAEARRFPEAAEELTQAVRFDPDNPNAHNNLGAVLFQMGAYDKAAAQFSDALQIDPSNANAAQNLALAQARMKKP